MHIYQALKLKFTLVIGGILFSGAFFVPYFTTNANLFLVLYSLGIGLGAGCSGYICILECWKHFSKAKGRVMGVMAACYGLSPTIFGLLFAFLCNPHNEEPGIKVYSGEVEYRLFSVQVADRVPWVSLTLGIVSLSCFLTVILLFPRAPEDVPVSLTGSIASLTSSRKRAVTNECPNLKTAMKTWVFWSLTLNMFCGITYGVFIVNVYKNYGMNFYQNDHLLSSIGSSAAFISAFGRVTFSVAMDLLSFKVVYGCNIAMQLAVSATITYIVPVSVYLYWVWIAISFFVFAGVFPSFILESSIVFGNKCEIGRTGAAAMSLIGQSFTLSSIATIGLSEVVGMVLGIQFAGNNWCFHFLAFLSLVSVVLTFTSPKSYIA